MSIFFQTRLKEVESEIHHTNFLSVIYELKIIKTWPHFYWNGQYRGYTEDR